MDKTYLKLILVWMVTSIWGIINIFSASYVYYLNSEVGQFRKTTEQTILFLIALFVIILVLKYQRQAYQIMYKSVDLLMAFTIISLILVLVIGTLTGVQRGGARSVIPIGPVDFQPLEMYKVVMILYFAKAVSSLKRKKMVFSELYASTFLILLGIFLVFIEPDFGGSLILIALLTVLLIINGENLAEVLKVLFVIFILGLVTVFVSLSRYAYQSERLKSWIDPFAETYGYGMQIINSIIAIYNGGYFGQGYLQSTQKTGFLVHPFTDFIYAVIIEEWGLLGGAFTIGLLVMIAYFCIKIGNNSNTRFGQVYSIGYAFLILIQTAVNVGGVTGVIPLTGVTLPFISSGMNSYVFLTMGLIFVVIIDIESNRQYRKYVKTNKKLYYKEQ